MTTTAKNFTKGRIKPIRLIVIHSMESQEKPGTAANVAKWFAGATAPQSSAHWCVDSQNAIQIVDDNDTAWSAPGANADGIHIELAGVAAQTRTEWLDTYSSGVLNEAAKIVASYCTKYAIPAVILTPAQVADGKTKGICGHITVTKAFPNLGSHTDPGANFPWDILLDKVHALLKTGK